MPSAWRIVRTKYEDIAFTGEGAAKYGGRWNSPGTFLVYTSGSLSLAALEVLVHLPGSTITLAYSAIKVDFDAAAVEELRTADLPAHWRQEPPTPATMTIGDDWVRAARKPVLAVPSILVPHEKNYLFNPVHPDFRKIKISKPEVFTFDPRLLGQSKK